MEQPKRDATRNNVCGLGMVCGCMLWVGLGFLLEDFAGIPSGRVGFVVVPGFAATVCLFGALMDK